MVAVWWSGAQTCIPQDEFETKKDRERGWREVMKVNELQTILGYLNIGLAIAHNAGVSVGHFGGTDFIQLAQSVNGLLLNAVTPAAAAPAAAPGAPAAADAAQG
jgi:hypothetical protein